MDDVDPGRWYVGLSRFALTAVVFGVFVGIMPFLITVSPLLLSTVYMIVFGGGALLVATDWRETRHLRSISAYLAWLLIYCYLGTLAASEGVPMAEVAKLYIKHLVVLMAFCLALTSSCDLSRLASFVQLAVLVNLAIAIWEVYVPELNATLAFMADPEANAFSLTRPAGLWRNPDEAATAYIFGFFMARWASMPLKWIGRVGALAGILFSASRTGVYVLALCGAIAGILAWRESGFRAKGLVQCCMLGLVAFLAVLAWIEFGTRSGSLLDEGGRMTRILDVSEKGDRGVLDPTRGEIARSAIKQALEGPWYGNGIFSFQVEPHLPAVVETGAHNVYLTVWGESGYVGIGAYLCILWVGLKRAWRSPAGDRRTMLMMWVSYLVIGLTWHNEFTAFSGMLYIGILWHIPSVLSGHPENGGNGLS